MADQERKRLIFLGVVLAVLAIVALVQNWGRDGLAGSGVSAEELNYEPRQLPQLVAIDIDLDVGMIDMLAVVVGQAVRP